MTWLHWLGAALLFLGSTAAGFALRQELRLRLRLLTAVIDSLNLLRSDIVGRLLPLPEALRMWSREVEHCQENLAALQAAFCSDPRLAAARLLTACLDM